jgi:hypothetical protein
MATIQRYVNTASTAGGDGTTNATSGANRAYPTLSAWEAGMGSGNSGDDYIVDCCGSTADSTALTVNFAALSILIRGNRGEADGFYDGDLVTSTSHYRLHITAGSIPLVLACNNTTVDGIQIVLDNTGSSLDGLSTGGAFGNTAVRNCRILRAVGQGSGIGLGVAGIAAGSANGYTYTYENNVIAGWQHAIRHRSPDFWTRTATFRHNTLYGGGGNNAALLIADVANSRCNYGVYANACGNTGSTASIVGTVGTGMSFTTADNVVSVASSTTDEIALGTASDAWTSPGLSASSDFSVKDASSVLYQVVNPTRVTLDITGFTRDGTNHDAGAFEFQAGSSLPTLTAINASLITTTGARLTVT